MQAPSKRAVTGVILAGGLARRMGGQDKGLVALGNRPLIEWVIRALSPQVARLLINANRNREAYGRYGLPVVADELAGFQGPLAGFLSAMRASTTPWLLTVPCDGPLLPPNLVARLASGLAEADAEIAVVRSGGRMQPVYALLPTALESGLQDFLATGDRKIARWYRRHRVTLVDFSDCPTHFANINSPADTASLERIILES